MTRQGINDVYMFMVASWPLQYKTWTSDTFQAAKFKQMAETFKDYKDEEVMNAFQKWAEENDNFPSTRQIINEIKWARTLRPGHFIDPNSLHMMEVIAPDGTEYVVEKDGTCLFNAQEFMNLARNKDHLDPEEWERRFKDRRRRILKAQMEAGRE